MCLVVDDEDQGEGSWKMRRKWIRKDEGKDDNDFIDDDNYYEDQYEDEEEEEEKIR